MYQYAHNVMQAHRMCVHLCERAREWVESENNCTHLQLLIRVELILFCEQKNAIQEVNIILFSSWNKWSGHLMSNNFLDGIFSNTIFWQHLFRHMTASKMLSGAILPRYRAHVDFSTHRSGTWHVKCMRPSTAAYKGEAARCRWGRFPFRCTLS